MNMATPFLPVSLGTGHLLSLSHPQAGSFVSLRYLLRRPLLVQAPLRNLGNISTPTDPSSPHHPVSLPSEAHHRQKSSCPFIAFSALGPKARGNRDCICFPHKYIPTHRIAHATAQAQYKSSKIICVIIHKEWLRYLYQCSRIICFLTIILGF